jgi:hypothetical protein
MGNLTTAMTFVMVLNVLMWFSQVATLEINPTGTAFYNNNDSLMCDFGDCSQYVIDEEGVTEKLPTGEGSISPTTGNLFTDIFSSITGWLGSVTGVKYLKEIISAPYKILLAMRVPQAFAFGCGVLWYGISLFVVLGFIFGRE